MEHKFQALDGIKFDGDDDEADAMTFSGYGAVFGNVDSYGDVIAPGAFKRTLKEARRKGGQWPAMLSQHGGYMGGGDNMPVGVWTELSEDETGLYVEGKLAPTPRGKEAYELLRIKPRPALTGLSIGFRTKSAVMGTKPDEPDRTLTDLELMEISLVTFPANGQARVAAVKSLADLAPEDLRDLEAGLRDAGFSRTEAVKAVSCFKAWAPRDAAPSPADRPGDQDFAALADVIRRNIENLK